MTLTLTIKIQIGKPMKLIEIVKSKTLLDNLTTFPSDNPMKHVQT